MLKLYGYWRSSASYRVRIALALKGLRYEYVAVNLRQGEGEQFGAAYRAVNPQSRVPTLEIDGLRLWQSSAIIEYLEERFAQPPLLPSGPAGRARVRALAALIVADMQPLQNQSITRYLQGPLHLDELSVQRWLHEWMRRGFEALETHLAGEAQSGHFCHGDTPGLADVMLVPQCYAAQRFGFAFDHYPTVARIHAQCEALPAFQQARPEAQPDAVG
ncbi:MAG: maleylacetoacetate isomerase [Steroidobacteraceae bacterium]